MMNLHPFFKYNRGSKVNFLGNAKYKPLNNTFIWAILIHDGYNVAYIEHPDGLLKSEFEAKAPFAPSDKVLPDNVFDTTKKYIEVTEQEIVFSDLAERQNRDNVLRGMIAELHNKLSR